MSYRFKPLELTTMAGAQKHIALIRQYWWARGYTKVDAWPVRLGMHRKKPVFGVRSNLVNGAPR